jgi:S-adenosylmethionine:tRNA ribosyltransferase-isomerase
MVQNTKATVKTYSVQSPADFKAKIIECHFEGMYLEINGREVGVQFIGKFNVSNLLAVYGAAVMLGNDPQEVFAACGPLPLPPYIKRPDQPLDSDRYQTIYAQCKGAVAAPTAGLHFTEKTFAALKEKGVERVELTLHVGAGTFKPVSEEKIEDHPMHAEYFVFTPEAAERLNRVHAAGGRILAVGTTSLRTLESCVDAHGVFTARTGETSIYIYPPYHVRSADMLLTNFHLPKSTLLMLVSAFAGMEPIRKAYRIAVQERMKFFSYGDCMLITGRV